jgi:hypothetical protein
MNYCSNCGFEIPTKSNFCSNCGEKRAKSRKAPSDTTLPNILNDDPLEEKYLVLQNKIFDLVKKSGFLVVSVGDRFIQFQKEKNKSFILFDLGYLKNIPVDKLSEVYKLGFVDQRGSLNKKITLTDREKGILTIAKQTKYIFEELFNCRDSEPFVFSEEYDDHQVVLKPQKKIQNQIKTAIYSPELLVKDDIKLSSSKPLSAKAIFFIIVIIIAIIGYFSKSTNRSNDTTFSKQDVVYNSPYDASVSQVEIYLKEQYLKDPDSYESISWGTVVLYDDVNDNYMVRHKFRAKNSFGGYDVEDKVFYLDKNGNVTDVKDFIP